MSVIIKYREETKIAHHFRRQELADKTLIFKVTHSEVQRFPASRNQQYPGTSILSSISRRLANTFNILEHGKAKRIRIYSAIPGAVIGRLEHHIGVAV
ncbi:Uncharacterised protein [Salmonella bongori]|nr:Uncharacterised protein [Salmonella bongori]